MTDHLDVPTLIFGNFVNELMTAVPGPGHAKSLNAVAPRKLWLASGNDMLVLPVNVPDYFRAYVAKCLGENAGGPQILVPSGNDLSLLARRIAEDDDAFSCLKEWVAGSSDAVALPFAVDRPTVALLTELGVPLRGYRDGVTQTVIDAIYRLNTKDGIRSVFTELGLPVVPGVRCRGRSELLETVSGFLKIYPRVLIKLNRGSNGYGHVVVDAEERDLAAKITAGLDRFAEQPEDFVVEQWMDFRASPSIELHIDEDDFQITYDCLMRLVGNSFSGIATPAAGLREHHQNRLRESAAALGRYLHGIGIRNICDLDAGLTGDGKIYFTEVNLRRTGGTYLDFLVRRLVGERYLEDGICWTADSVPASEDISFEEGVRRLEGAGIQFDKAHGRGVILTADTLAVDGKWRYLVIARSVQEAARVEAEAAACLRFAEARP